VDGADVARAAHRETRWDGEASVGNATAVDSTSTAEDAATAAGRRGYGAGHAAKEMRQMRESWIAAYGMTWEGTEGEAFGRRPSCRECLYGPTGLAVSLLRKCDLCWFLNQESMLDLGSNNGQETRRGKRAS
jgi:hypothetical protein